MSSLQSAYLLVAHSEEADAFLIAADPDDHRRIFDDAIAVMILLDIWKPMVSACVQAWPLNGDRLAVIGRPGLAFRKKFCFPHPTMGAFEHLSRVRFEHQPFSGAETVDVDHGMIFFRQLFQKVVLVALRLQIDVALRPL